MPSALIQQPGQQRRAVIRQPQNVLRVASSTPAGTGLPGVVVRVVEQPAAPSPVGVLSYPAATVINGQRCVWLSPEGIRHVHHEDPVGTDSALGISLNAANPGDTVNVRPAGTLVEASWNWTPALPIYVVNDGLLTQQAPDHGAVLEVGFALTSTSIYIRLREPDFLQIATE